MSTLLCCDENEKLQLTRRGVLGRGLAVGAGAALTGLAGEALSTSLAFAAGTYTGDTLVVVSLRGGFDGLSAFAPIGDTAYYQARPGIAVPKSKVIGGDGGMFGLHPALAPLLPQWKAGKLAAVHAIGQPDPTRSHFAAMEAMENAAPGTSIRSGWLDRMLGLTGASGPVAAVSMGDAMPARLMAGPSADVSMKALADFTLAADGKRPMAAALRAMYSDAPTVLAGPALAADRALAATAAVKGGYSPANGAVYPDSDLGGALRDVARLIKAGSGLVTAAVDCGDWDMHQGLGPAVAGERMYDNLLGLSQALAAFVTDLGEQGMKKVTVLTISEFGRRVKENGSRGADHGHGNAMMLLGGGIRGGKVYGDWPGLDPRALVAGDLAATTDYRSVIGEVLQKRCGLGALDTVFPGVRPSSFGLAAAR
ncbi:DUF1501 domain-containing protein [Actinoplanes subglobosus]|uniref:DUF1501 domain-containing protein n=1 Tax=Actinoplanes subglobosus TaxID=1547892 RepID=A0ABV8J728_9ACTN